MLIDILWPADLQVQISSIEETDGKLIVVACGLQEQAHCPDCQQLSARFNGYYHRHPAHLPCGGYAIQLNLCVFRRKRSQIPGHADRPVRAWRSWKKMITLR